jgi:hypothetical protein
MSNCKKVVELYEEFKKNSIKTANSAAIEQVVDKYKLQIIYDQVKEWAIKKGLEKVFKETGKKIGEKIFSAPVAVVTGVLEPSELKTGVEQFHDTLKSIIIDLGQTPPDRAGAYKKIAMLRVAIDTIQIEERGTKYGNANCFDVLNKIAMEIEALCAPPIQQSNINPYLA